MDDRRELIEAALDHLAEARECLEEAGLMRDGAFRAYHAASLEGVERGWMGHPTQFLVDAVRAKLEAEDEDEDEDEDDR